jgi:hypothetical protein
MKQTIYTLISYIPGEEGGRDRCGDYYSGKESNLKVQSFMDQQSIGEAMAYAKFEDDDTEFTILVNGLNEDESYDFLTEDDQWELEKTCSDIRDLSYRKLEELQQIKLQQLADAKLKKEQQAALALKQQQERIEQAERAQLAQLQAKYGN